MQIIEQRTLELMAKRNNQASESCSKYAANMQQTKLLLKIRRPLNLKHSSRMDGGEGGIRTLDTGFGPYNGLAMRTVASLVNRPIT